MQLYGWVFMPTQIDLDSQAPTHVPGYYMPLVGEVALLPTTTNLADTSQFQPGWKRATWLDGVIQ